MLLPPQKFKPTVSTKFKVPYGCFLYLSCTSSPVVVIGGMIVGRAVGVGAAVGGCTQRQADAGW